MGQKLVQIYSFLDQNGGLPAKMRLAMMTGIPSDKAESEADSPENLSKFKSAVKEITGKDVPIV